MLVVDCFGARIVGAEVRVLEYRKVALLEIKTDDTGSANFSFKWREGLVLEIYSRGFSKALLLLRLISVDVPLHLFNETGMRKLTPRGKAPTAYDGNNDRSENYHKQLPLEFQIARSSLLVFVLLLFAALIALAASPGIHLDIGNPELASEFAERCQVEIAHDIDYGNFAGFG